MAEGASLEDALATAVGASILSRIAFGKRRGSKLRTDATAPSLYIAPDPNKITYKGRRSVQYRGFSLHANTAVKQGDEQGLVQLIKYMARPPIATERLSLRDPANPQGDLKYALKSEWDNGARHVFFSPKELIEKIIAIIPPRYFNMIRYFGILGPNHSLRSRIVKKRKRRHVLPRSPKNYAASSSSSSSSQNVKESAEKLLPKSPYWINWDELLKRTFRVNPERCPVCSGKMRVVDLVMRQDIIHKILTHQGIDPAPPPRRKSPASNFTYEPVHA